MVATAAGRESTTPPMVVTLRVAMDDNTAPSLYQESGPLSKETDEANSGEDRLSSISL
jgi:hypothetical protein